MGQNTSHAVMAQRAEPHDSLDDFPTPPWATRAFLRHGIDVGKGQVAWEPACNRGYMARPLAEHFSRVIATDIHDYGYIDQAAVSDFLFPGSEPEDGVDWIITNPPFRLAEQFYIRAMGIARVGFALLVRTQFLEGVGRFSRVFENCPPDEILQYSERVPMVKGRYDRKASTATSYCWIVRYAIPTGITIFRWIPPCRGDFELANDSRCAA